MRIFIDRDNRNIRLAGRKKMGIIFIRRSFFGILPPKSKICCLRIAARNDFYPAVLLERHRMRGRLFAPPVKSERKSNPPRPDNRSRILHLFSHSHLFSVRRYTRVPASSFTIDKSEDFTYFEYRFSLFVRREISHALS